MVEEKITRKQVLKSLQDEIFKDKKELMRLKGTIDLCGDEEIKKWLKELYDIKYQRIWQSELKLREIKS